MSYNPYSKAPVAPDYPVSPAPELPVPTPAPLIKLPGPTAATVCFLIVAVLFNVFGIVGTRVFNLSSIWVTFIGEIGIVALVPLIFCVLRRYDFKRTFSIQKLNFGTVMLCGLVGLSAQFALRFPSLLTNWFLQIFGPLYLPDLDDGTPVGRWVTLVALIGLAPLCEEILNRGFVMAGYRRIGFGRCILIVGIFFGFFHQYPYRFLDTTCAGILLAYLALTTGSIFASMTAHFGFNLFPAIVTFFQQDINRFLRENNSGYEYSDTNVLIITGQQVVTSLIISLFGAALVFLLLRVITRRTARIRPGLVLSYSGLAKDIVEGATSHENGLYYGPANQPYRYTPLGYERTADPFPLRPAGYATRPRLRVATAGWSITVLLLLSLFAFTSYTELALRAKGQVYCRDHPRSCQPLSVTESPPGPETIIIENR